MNIGLALTAAPPTCVEPAPPEVAGDTGLFAVLFGQRIAANPPAASDQPSIQPPILIAPAGGLDAMHSLTRRVEAVDLKMAAAAQTEPQVSGVAATPTIANPEKPANGMAVLNAAASLLSAKPVLPDAEVPPPVDSEQPAGVVAPGMPQPGQQLLAQREPAPAVQSASKADAAIAVGIDPNPPPPAGPTNIPQASEQALASLAASPAVDNAQTTAGAPAQAAVSAVQPPPQVPPVPAQAILLPTRPERLTADVAVEVVRQISAGRNEFTIRLDPPDLGRIDVQLEFDGGTVRAVVTTDNPQTHDFLRRDADGLARLLEMNGFKADSSAFRFDLRQDGGQSRGFAGTQQSPTRNTEAEAAAEPMTETARSTRRGLLDLVA